MANTLSTFQIDAALRHLARPQLGLVTVAQAEAAGLDRWALERRREAGALAPMFTEVMRLTAAPSTPEQQILGAALAVPGCVVAATSAAFVHGLPVLPVDEPTVAVAASRSARTTGVVTIRQRVELPSGQWHSVRVASPAAALVLLPRFVAPFTLERCLDHCLAHRLTSVPAVAALIDSLHPRAVVGRRLLIELLEQRSSGIGHRSRLEQQVAGWLDDAGLCGWVPNHRVVVGGAATVEVDFAWPKQMVALEVSPFFTHGSRVTQDRDAVRRRLLVQRGWRIVEATDPDLESAQSFRASIQTLRTLLADPALRSRALGGAGRSAAHTTSGEREDLPFAG